MKKITLNKKVVQTLSDVCQAWNDYFIEDKESGSFDRLRKRLKHLVSYLQAEVINGRIK